MTMLPAPAKIKLGLVIDLDTCVGCHACAVACKEWNDGGQFGPLPDVHTQGAGADGVWFNRVHSYEVEDRGLGTGDQALASDHAQLNVLALDGLGEEAATRNDAAQVRTAPVLGPRSPVPASMTIHFPRSCLHCETPDCVTVCPTGASYKRAEDGIVLVDEDKCIGCQLCAWACPYGAREFNHDRGVMQKCTLCVDRIYNETLDETDRQPACVAACPTRARHFGDLGDPGSTVSQLVAERDGFGLQPELGYRPVNRYLPPRKRRGADADAAAPSAREEAFNTDALPTPLRWLDRLLSR